MAQLNGELVERMQRDHKTRQADLQKQQQTHTIQKMTSTFDKALRDNLQSKTGFKLDQAASNLQIDTVIQQFIKEIVSEVESFKIDESLLSNMISVWTDSTKRFESDSIAPNFSAYYAKAKKDATAWV